MLPIHSLPSHLCYTEDCQLRRRSADPLTIGHKPAKVAPEATSKPLRSFLTNTTAEPSKMCPFTQACTRAGWSGHAGGPCLGGLCRGPATRCHAGADRLNDLCTAARLREQESQILCDMPTTGPDTQVTHWQCGGRTHWHQLAWSRQASRQMDNSVPNRWPQVLDFMRVQGGWQTGVNSQQPVSLCCCCCAARGLPQYVTTAHEGMQGS